MRVVKPVHKVGRSVAPPGGGSSIYKMGLQLSASLHWHHTLTDDGLHMQVKLQPLRRGTILPLLALLPDRFIWDRSCFSWTRSRQRWLLRRSRSCRGKAAAATPCCRMALHSQSTSSRPWRATHYLCSQRISPAPPSTSCLNK